MARNKIEVTLSTQSVKRLPLYLRILGELRDAGDRFVSSAVVAEQLNLDPIMVRKDLAGCGVTGKPRLGFPLDELYHAVERILGCDNACEAIMVGVGKLGTALLGYPGFAQYGIHITAAFDLVSSPSERHKVPIYPIRRLEEIIPQTQAKIGILTVPADAAQEMANRLVSAGICGLWNFTPMHLHVPENIIVKRENLAISLVVLAHRLRSAKLI